MHWYFFLTTDGAMCSAHFSATSQTHLEELLNTYTQGLDHLVLFITRSKFWAYFCQNGFAFLKKTLISKSLWKSKQTAVGHPQISRKACIPLCYEVMRDLKQAFLWKFVCGRIAEVWKWPQTLQTWAQWKQFLYWKSNSSSKKEFFIYKRRKKDRTTRSLLRSFWKWCLLWKKQ